MKALKWIVIILVALGILGYFGMGIAKKNTKKHSPEAVIEHKSGDFEMSVFYCRPYKKGRKIFGDLAPYDEVWRTGANEPTTITFNRLINFGGERIAAGTYSLWTIPQQTQWTVILNSEIPDWGANFSGEAAHNPKYDVIKVNVAAIESTEIVEQFTMEFIYNVNLKMAWDDIYVTVPIQF